MELEDEGRVRLAGGMTATAHDWDAAAAAVLRRAGRLADDAPAETAWDKLARRTVEGLVVPPLGTPGRLAGAGGPAFPELSGAAGSVSGWDIRAQICDPDPASAAASAVSDLENGATSLWVTVGGPGTAPEDLGSALTGVFLEMAPIVISASGAISDVQAAQAVIRLFEERGITPAPGTGLGADPVGRSLTSDRPLPAGRAQFDHVVAEIATLAKSVGVRALAVDGTAAHCSGAGDAAELGYCLAVGVEYLRALQSSGYSPDEAFGLLEFRYAATSEQFPTIAKFRAARGLWHRVAELSGAADTAGEQLQHAVTSLPMLTRYDPWVNLLRTTVAAFAAGAGGADAVTVLPFDTRLGMPDALGRRLARNISSLLISESHVAAVADPAGGSQAVELLTAELAEAAWTEFQRIERSGGAIAALGDGSLRSRWAATATDRARRIATRRQPITGVSEFPNLREVLPTRRPAPHSGAPATSFWAEPFETMRDEPAAAPVFLATLGSVAEHSPRAGFAANLFAAGGVETVTAGRTEGVDDVLAAFRETGTAVACLAGTDRAYADIGAEVIRVLRGAGAVRVMLAGQPSETLADVVDDHIAAGDDVVAFLRRTRSHLLETEASR